MSGLRSTIAGQAGGQAHAYAKFAAETIRLHTQKCSSGMMIRIATVEHRK
jgi:hypothetical protein